MRTRFYQNLVESVVSLWLPVRCVHCKRVSARGGDLCAACATLLEDSRLMHYDLPLSVGPFPLMSRWVFSDASPVRSIHHAFKYEARTDLAPVLARPLAQVLRGLRGPHAPLACVGVPLACVGVPMACVGVPSHRLRVLERGYCQAAVLAQCLAAELGVPYLGGLLERREHASSQTLLSAAERLANVRRAFRFTGSGAAPKTVVLVDDVVTTGATLLACAQVLVAAGARHVVLAAPAVRPPLPGDGHFNPV